MTAAARCRLAVFALGFALLLAASHASAQEAVNTFGDGLGFLPGSGHQCGIGLTTAFRSAATGQVSTVQVAVTYTSGLPVGRIAIYSNEVIGGASQPGDLAASWIVDVPPAGSTSPVHLAVSDGPMLVAGELYWIAVRADAPTALTWAHTSAFDLYAGLAYLQPSGGWLQIASPDVAPAYSVTVPAPAGLVVLGSVVVSCERRRR